MGFAGTVEEPSKSVLEMQNMTFLKKLLRAPKHWRIKSHNLPYEDILFPYGNILPVSRRFLTYKMSATRKTTAAKGPPM